MQTHPTASAKLLIFDLDGTLLDSLPDIATAVQQTLADFALPTLDSARIGTMIGGGARQLCLDILQVVGGLNSLHCLKNPNVYADTQGKINSNNVDNFAHDLPTIDVFFQQFLANYAANPVQNSTLYPNVLNGLRTLKTRYTLALLTNKPAAFLPTILSHFALVDLFAITIGGDDFTINGEIIKKPRPEPLLHICQTLHINPAQTAMIGDSQNDVQAGKNAGVTTLALSYGYNYGRPISDCAPDKVFDNFAALVIDLMTTTC